MKVRSGVVVAAVIWLDACSPSAERAAVPGVADAGDSGDATVVRDPEAGVLDAGSDADAQDRDADAQERDADADADAAQDAGDARDVVDAGRVVNGCATFEDDTAASATRAIPWDFSVTGSPARCMRIAAGQTVSWIGSQVEHPRRAAGGDTPSPLTAATGASAVTFPAVGVFGFVCDNHPFMTGAIEVVP